MGDRKSGNPWALLPLGVFLILYLVTSLVTGDFYKMPVVVAFLVAALVALIMTTDLDFSARVEQFSEGAGDRNIMVMCLIFVLAGAFARVSEQMGATTATVDMGLYLLPPEVLIAGLFVISCFISISVGTSVGTIAALAPIAVGLSGQMPFALGLTLGAVVGGAMFGDNLSIISDTTIAATRTQGCSMKDKFWANIWIVLPAAIITVVLYLLLFQTEIAASEEYTIHIWRVLPYIFVLISAIAGLHVVIVLSSGILVAGSIGFIQESFNIWEFVQAVSNGIGQMTELIVICLLIGGIAELIRYNGGIEYLLNAIRKKIDSQKGAEIGIGILVTLVNLCTANNTVAIIVSGPIARQVADRFGVPGDRSASLLDTFSCFTQGIIPYGAQILTAVSVAGTAVVSPLDVMMYLYYPYLLGGSVLISIIFRMKPLSTAAKKRASA